MPHVPSFPSDDGDEEDDRPSRGIVDRIIDGAFRPRQVAAPIRLFEFGGCCGSEPPKPVLERHVSREAGELGVA
ncbi:hypothetical protein D8S78_06000 [Natrialba swarupiae]|nr:hypothetical protein [Natrialba swarupiae]